MAEAWEILSVEAALHVNSSEAFFVRDPEAQYRTE